MEFGQTAITRNYDCSWMGTFWLGMIWLVCAPQTNPLVLSCFASGLIIRFLTLASWCIGRFTPSLKPSRDTLSPLPFPWQIQKLHQLLFWWPEGPQNLDWCRMMVTGCDLLQTLHFEKQNWVHKATITNDMGFMLYNFLHLESQKLCCDSIQNLQLLRWRTRLLCRPTLAKLSNLSPLCSSLRTIRCVPNVWVLVIQRGWFMDSWETDGLGSTPSRRRSECHLWGICFECIPLVFVLGLETFALKEKSSAVFDGTNPQCVSFQPCGSELPSCSGTLPYTFLLHSRNTAETNLLKSIKICSILLSAFPRTRPRCGRSWEQLARAAWTPRFVSWHKWPPSVGSSKKKLASVFHSLQTKATHKTVGLCGHMRCRHISESRHIISVYQYISIHISISSYIPVHV